MACCYLTVALMAFCVAKQNNIRAEISQIIISQESHQCGRTELEEDRNKGKP